MPLPREPSRSRRPVVLLAAAVAIAGGCGRSEASRAAERAQDACITALEPVAGGGGLSGEAVRNAVAAAEDAARSDVRWRPLRRRLQDLDRALRTGDRAALAGAGHAVEEECRRVNAIVREGG